jgi:hypothetical protein
LPRYKYLAVKKVDLASFAPKPTKRALSPRQVAQHARDEEIRAALNEAAALPASQAVVIDLKEGQKLATLRAAVNRMVDAEPRDLNWGVRGQSIVVSKGEIPGGRRSRRSA